MHRPQICFLYHLLHSLSRSSPAAAEGDAARRRSHPSAVLLRMSPPASWYRRLLRVESIAANPSPLCVAKNKMNPLLWHKVAGISGVAALGLGTYGAHGFKPQNPVYKEVDLLDLSLPLHRLLFLLLQKALRSCFSESVAPIATGASCSNLSSAHVDFFKSVLTDCHP